MKTNALILLVLFTLVKFINCVDFQGCDLPFSQIAEIEDYPVNNIYQWLQSPERYQHKDGKPKRPMNAFFLYKNAYYFAMKLHLATTLSNVISSFCGQCWKTESPQIISLYGDASEFAHQKHKEIFPNYRYTPAPRVPRVRRQSINENKEKIDELSHETTEDLIDAPHENISLEEWYRL